MDVIRKKELEPLSSEQLLKLVNYKSNLIVYPDLHKYSNIYEILGPHKACILLYETSSNFGHWTCLYLYNNHIIFHDSYGFIPDDELKFIPRMFRKQSMQNYRYLTKLLYESGLVVEYNEFQLQSKKNKIATCGYHVATRLNYRSIPIKIFAEILSSYMPKITPDDLVILLNIK